MDFMDVSKKWMNESSEDQKQAQSNNYFKDNFNVFLSLFWKVPTLIIFSHIFHVQMRMVQIFTLFIASFF
jgi:hypothetical protein